jgi:hypothetical protein
MTRTVVLFEGASDRLAVEAASRRLGVGLDGLDLVDLDGITNLRAVLRDLLTRPDEVRVLGLYDAAEGAYVRRVLSDLGVLEDDGADPEGVGFFGCERDLEDEAIAAAGPDLVVETLDARGELARFRVFQGQPAQRERAVEDQLHRFAGTAAGRKARFAADVIDVIPLERMPRPLVALLDAALAG